MALEYAPQYTFKERLRHVAVILPISIALYLLYEWWLLPKLRAFSDHAVCETVFGVPGPSVLFFGIFVFMPLLFALVTAGVFLPIAVRSIKTRRYPPPGKKVYRSTKIKTGSQAIVSSMAPLVLVLFLFGVAVWGYGQASQILNRAYSMHPNGWKKCEANKAKTSPL